MVLAFAVVAGYLVAFISPFIYQLTRRYAGWILSLLPLGLTIYFVRFLNLIDAENTVKESIDWVPTLGVSLSFHVDGLSLVFALLICGIGTLIVLYASSYLEGDPLLGRLYAYLLAFMASMLGLVLADNIITLFIFWELTSITSYLLIGFDHKREEARWAASQALVITGAGGLVLLAGLIMLGQVGGSWTLSELLQQGEQIRAHALYVPILILILIGAFTKSAQFPFHFWLPGAMEAPTPISAYLHSATMVKAGVYLLARLYPVLGQETIWFNIVVTVGLVTMLVGAFLALFNTDLKRILAYSTISALGTLVMLLGLNDYHAVEAAMVFLVVHSLYKGALFMMAGAVYHEVGTRDIEQLGGLRHVMPFLAVGASLAALSMAGIPLFFGFIGKEIIYDAGLHAPSWPYLITAAAVIANIAMVAVAGIVSYHIFFGPKVETPKKGHPAPLRMWLGPILLGIIGLILGTVPVLSDGWVSSASSSVLAEVVSVHLAIWHGFNIPLVLSIITVSGGVGLFLIRDQVRQYKTIVEQISNIGPAQIYRTSLQGTEVSARFITRNLQDGRLRHYIALTIIVAVGLVGYTLFSFYGFTVDLDSQLSEIRPYELIVSVIILIATLAAVRAQSRLAAVAALGVVGYGMGLLFILFSAPDLAMTQISIETLTVVLLVLILYRLPNFVTFATPRTRMRDRVIALTAGGLMTTLVLTVTSLPFQSRLAPYFAEMS
ncbi:MAG: putative monovalent cation/H+ antiporter subunit A, partial [Chloroflexota bacterium]